MDYYGELLIPIVSDLPFAQRVELELGGRYSDYEDTDSTFTYKITGNWQFNDWLRLRGGYNRATRAPNLGELFLNVQEIFTIGGANFGDPCGLRSNAPYGAGGVAPDPVADRRRDRPPPLAAGQTVEGAHSAYLICQAQMGTTGATQFYGEPGGVPLGHAGCGRCSTGCCSRATRTWSPKWPTPGRRAWCSRRRRTIPGSRASTASVDWWKVDISDAIQQYSMDYAQLPLLRREPRDHVRPRRRRRRRPEPARTWHATSPAAARSPRCSSMTTRPRSRRRVSTLSINWFAQFEDIGLAAVPGGLGVNVTVGWTRLLQDEAVTAAHRRRDGLGRARWGRTCRAPTRVPTATA